MPATYVIGRGSIVAYASVHPDYRTRPDPVELIEVLDSVKLDYETHDVHLRYGDRSKAEIATASGAQPVGESFALATWFVQLSVELVARGKDGQLSAHEHSYAAERCFLQIPSRFVAQEIHAARLGLGELWTE
jgi:hypothetical protein